MFVRSTVHNSSKYSNIDSRKYEEETTHNASRKKCEEVERKATTQHNSVSNTQNDRYFFLLLK